MLKKGTQRRAPLFHHCPTSPPIVSGIAGMLRLWRRRQSGAACRQFFLI